MAQAGLRECREFSCESFCGLACSAIRHHAVDETHFQRFACADRAASQDKVHRTTHTDQAGQAHRPAVDERHAPAATENTKNGALFGDTHVAPQGEFKTARNRWTGDGRDDRFRQQEAAWAHGPSIIENFQAWLRGFGAIALVLSDGL